MGLAVCAPAGPSHQGLLDQPCRQEATQSSRHDGPLTVRKVTANQVMPWLRLPTCQLTCFVGHLAKASHDGHFIQCCAVCCCMWVLQQHCHHQKQ